MLTSHQTSSSLSRCVSVSSLRWVKDIASFVLVISHLSTSHLLAKVSFQILLNFCFYSTFSLFSSSFFHLRSLFHFEIIFWYRTILLAIQFCCYIFDLRVAHYWYTFLHLVDILTFVLNQTTQLAWSIHEFLQTDHSFNSLLNNVDRRTIEIFTIRSFKSSKIRVHDVAHLSQWIDDVTSFQNALNQFRIDTERFRQSKVY